MKKVLFISYDGMTDPLGQSQVLPYLAGLSRQGYVFTILSFEKKERFKKNASLIQSICDQNQIRWEPLFFTRRPPLLSKWYDNWQMKRKVKQLHREHRFNHLHCRSYVAAAAGLSLWKSRQIPFLFDMRGFWVDERVDNGQWDLSKPLYKFMYRVFKKKEKKYLAAARHIISLTQNGKDELVDNHQVPADKITVIPCCADLDHFDYRKVDTVAKENARKALGMEKGEKVLSYLGSLGGWYLTDEMLDFFSVLKETEPGAKFLFITHDSRESIMNKAVSKGLKPEDIMVQPASRKEVPLYLSLSTWSIFFIKDAYSKKASSPTKQGEIMAMGLPLICNDIGDTGKIVTAADAGIVLHRFDKDTFHKAAATMPQLAQKDKAVIRAAAFTYYDLGKGVEIYTAVYKQQFS